jgi:hypothetical protein
MNPAGNLRRAALSQTLPERLIEQGSVQYFSHIRFGLSGLRYWLKR